MMNYGIDKIWKAEMIFHKETNPDREQRKRKYRRHDEEDDTITISKEAKECCASIPSEEDDTI